VEGRRPRHPHPHRNQGGVREAAIAPLFVPPNCLNQAITLIDPDWAALPSMSVMAIFRQLIPSGIVPHDTWVLIA
jgi:hypothetical protein